MEAFERIQLSFNCPKAFDELQPCKGGWYCDGCQKMVHDFRGMDEEQILNVFANSGTKLCGLYEAERIKIAPQQPKWFKWASAALFFFGISALHNNSYAQTDVKLAPPVKKLEKDTTDRALMGEVVVLPLNDSSSVYAFGRTEVNPEFPGGEAAVVKYIQEHVKNTGDFTGRVFVQFTVERNGSLTDIKITRSGGKTVDDEIIKAMKTMPKWKPGMQNGKPYRVQYTTRVNLGVSK